MTLVKQALIVCLACMFVMLSRAGFAQSNDGPGIDASATGYHFPHERVSWMEIGERLVGPGTAGIPETVEIEVIGGKHQTGIRNYVYKVTYLITSKGGLTINRMIEGGEVPNAFLKIYDTGLSSTHSDRYVLYIQKTFGYNSVIVRARDLSKGKWLTITESSSAPTTGTDVTASAQVITMPYAQADGRLRMDGDIAGMWVESGNIDWFVGRSASLGSSLRFHYGGVDRMTLTPEGNVGIGVAPPASYKLAVNGKIGAREVEVHTNAWADFVFKKDYQLPSLQAVEAHIKEKGHLPDIPSEKEVKEKGISLGEMDAKLLQKIEELTLYLIEQNKALQVQQQAIKELQQENLELKMHIDSQSSK
jgi:hypothetical protein